AYDRTEQYGEETEIKLIRTGDVRPAVENPSGMICPWYLYRVADRDNMAQDYEYIRVVITNSAWSQIHDFTYFYDGPAPGDVPDDEKAEPVDPDGTEREGVQTINGIKGNLGAIDFDNMGLTSNGNNSNYIGASSGIVIYPDDAKDAWAVFATEGINNFWVKFLIGNADVAANFKAKFYVAPTADADESEWTEISAHIEECTDKKQPTGWKTLEYVMDEDQVIPVGSNVLKVFIPAAENNNIGTSCQIARVDYTYAIPEADPLPEKAEPDSANGEKALLEDLAGQHLTTEEGGLAEEEYGLEWMMQNLGGENGKDKVLYKIDYESYLIYKLDGAVTGIDISGYRHEDGVDDLLVYVSTDGSEWIALEDFTRADSKLYGGPVNYAHIVSAEDIPAGMNYVKVELPELEVFTDITISDIQILYNKTLLDDATDNNNGTDNDTDDKNESNPDTGVVLPLAALLLAGMSGATLVVGRKRDDR
ncbi:MAG: hypothetical protein IJZ13_09570, partial [Clostridia bacterium]|nr:hypothetical protein [Clostridia bacterium]